MPSYDNEDIFTSPYSEYLLPESMWRGKPEAISETIGNIPSSAYQLGSDISNIVLHPIQTAKGIGQFGLGLAQLAIPGEQGNEDVARSVGQHFVDRYGSLDAAKQAVTTDPVGVLADVSALLLGGGYLATKAGIKSGQVATKVGLATDPLIATGRGVAGIGKGVTRRDVLKGTGAGLASLAVPMGMMTDVTKVTKAIPPIAKSTGVLAGIGKFRGIMDNLAPYLRGSEKRINILDETRKAKPIGNDQAIRNVFEKKFPTIGHDSSFGLRVKTPKVKNQMDQFGKQYNLKDSDFSIVNTRSINEDIIPKLKLWKSGLKDVVFDDLHPVSDISKKLDNVPDKKFTIGDTFFAPALIAKKLDNTPDKKFTIGKVDTKDPAQFAGGLADRDYPNVSQMRHPYGTDNMEHRLTTGTVDGVPVMKVEYYSEFVKGEMTKINEELYIPNKQGLEKLAKPKSTLDEIDIFAGN